MAPTSRSPAASSPGNIHPYRMRVSQRYLDLTKQKLELTRLPREPLSSQQFLNFGVAKPDLEPLIDHWLEDYDWRKEEALFNDTLPQYRGVINGARLHFVHRRSPSPNAIPLLFVHGFPESFISVSRVIDALCTPVVSPTRPGDSSVPAFHVVAPSIPGFGFSDPVSEEGNAIPTTAAIFDSLMKTLGYRQYIVHGSGWAFKICRMLALAHSDSCIAIHTVNPDVPTPRSSIGYTNEDIVSGLPMPSHGLTPPLTPGLFPQPTERPQTAAYALCDSPPGFLAYMLDAIQPEMIASPPSQPRRSSVGPPSAAQSPMLMCSPESPATSISSTTPAPGRSPQHSRTPQPALELDVNSPWTPTAIINWTMIYWLPGPEVPLRWLVNSAALVPTLWLSHCNVPLGITHFRDPMSPGTGTGQTPPQWTEAYHRVAMLRRRDGRVRFPAWERPAEVVTDIRELASILGSALAPSADMMTSLQMSIPSTSMPPPPLPTR